MFGTIDCLEEMFAKIYRFMGLTLFVSKYLPFSEPEVTFLSPRTALNIRFRPGQVYLFGMGGISPKIWRHLINRK